jgi:stage III sporulation protein AE
MKRVFLVLAVLLCLLCVPIFAQESNPFGSLQEYLPKEAYDYVTEEELAQLQEGNLSPNLFFSRLISLWNTVAPTLASSFLRLVGMLLFFAAFRHLFQSEKSGADLAASVTFSIYSYSILLPLLSTCKAVTDALHALMNAFAPTVTALYLLGGNQTAAATQGSLLAWFLAVMQQIIASLFLPLAHALLSFIMLGQFCENSSFFTLSQHIRRILTWGVGIFFGILALVMGYQSSIAQAADRFATRGLKFVFGSFLPYAGGAISESTRALLGGLSLIISSAGVVGILCIFGIVAPPIVTLLCHLFFFSFASLVAQWFGCQKESVFLTQIGEVLKFLLLFLVSYAIFLIFFLTLFLNSTVAYAT